MSLFGCRHRWDEASRTWNPPSGREFDLRGMSVGGTGAHDIVLQALDMQAAAMFGFTVVELRCGECGDVTFRTAQGRSDRPAAT